VSANRPFLPASIARRIKAPSELISQKSVSGQRGPFPTADLRALRLRLTRFSLIRTTITFAQDPLDCHLGYVKLVQIRREPTIEGMPAVPQDSCLKNDLMDFAVQVYGAVGAVKQYIA